VIVLTAPWHERDTKSLAERLRASVFVAPPDTQEDLMQKYGLTAEQAADGSPDLAWLRAGDTTEAHWFAAGDSLPIGAEVFPGREHNDVVLWLEDHRAVIAGDSLVDFGRGLEIPNEWLREGVTREQVADGLRPLLDLPVELVLPAHGRPTDRAALERALT
jgi:glyoxylase-like metal-dependent hydrolase (beta-lactamase superfamily II)